MDKINISRTDVLWGYISQVFNVGANLFILPVLFRFLSSEILGVWYIFMNIGTFVTLFGLIFQSTFSRNIAYAFSGVTSLQKYGIDTEAEILDQPNYPLIKGLILTMKRFYGVLSIAIAIFLLAFGIPYFHNLSALLPEQWSIVSSWCLYALSIASGFYCLHFGSILQGRGYMKEFNQLTIINRLIYIFLVFIFVSQGYLIWGIAIANLVSVAVHYLLGFLFAYKNRLRERLKQVQATSTNLMRIVWANTYKLSFATILIYISTKGNLFYVSLFLPLDVIAQYGLSLQVINVLNTTSLMYFYSYIPMVAQGWVAKDQAKISEIYAKGLVICLLIFLVGAVSILFFGDFGLNLIGSNTTFLPTLPLLLLFVVYFLDVQHLLAINLIVSKNKVLHLKESILSTIAIFVMIPILIVKFDLGIYGVILSVGIVQACCHNWKWPWVVSRELGMSFIDQLKLGVNSLLHVKIKHT